MASAIDQIKDRVDIVDLISSYLKLQKSGVNYKARCPFHNEKSGSFFVSPERQIWHCFGCGLGGDAFGFVKQIEGVEFPEALRVLAARAGVDLHKDEKSREEYREFQSERTKLLDICELASKFFEKQLWQSNSGKKVLEYLHGRGLADDSIRKFRLGWSPDSWSSLLEFLVGRGCSEADVIGAGLAVRRSSDSVPNSRFSSYDRFRSRIMFPVFDINGQAVGFSGRIFEIATTSQKTEVSVESAGAKYINTPQTAIYDKSRVLYGLHAAKLDVRRQNRCLIVEGNVDVIMSHQAGASHVVASSGTALTDQHLKIIKRYTDNLDLCFDADSAGSMATERGVDLALARGFNVGIVTLDDPVAKDPADYVQKYGTKWAEYSQKSQPFMEFFLENTKKTVDLTAALGKKLLTQKILPFLVSMVNKVEQAHWVGELAFAIKTKEEAIYQELAVTKPRVDLGEHNPTIATNGLDSPAIGEVVSGPKLDPVEEIILALVMKKPDLLSGVGVYGEFLSVELKRLFEGLRLTGEKPAVALASISNADKILPMSVEYAYLKSQELWQDLGDKELGDEFHKLLSQVKRRRISERLASLESEIRTAEREQNKERLSALISDFSKVSNELQE